MLDQVVAATEKAFIYTPIGETEEIELTDSVMYHRLVKPSKAGRMPDKRDRDRFRVVCASRKLNPYAGDVFFVGYDNSKTNTTEWSLIIGIDTYYKRAELNPKYDGAESGVRCQNIQSGEIAERAGDAALPGEKIIGGWCRVHRKDRRFPTYRAVTLAAYEKSNDFWKRDRGGMIRKTAQKAALREAFPNEVGALYTAEFTSEEEQPRGEYKDVGLSPGLRAVVEATVDPPADDQAEQETVAEQQQAAQETPTSKAANLVQGAIDPLLIFRKSVEATTVADRLQSKFEEFARECPELTAQAQEIVTAKRFELETASK